ncbi:MAG: response regulator [Acidobacteriota bacterium]|nr:response regulator [Acidobacteriota bacterium]
MSETSEGHILYCEDHDDTRVLMTILLERAGFRVTAATNVSDCLELAQGGERFDLYLLNHTFPDASGTTLCEALRESDAETPILFYSARAMEREKEAGLRAGAQDYLIKPDDLFNVANHAAKWIKARNSKGGSPEQ